MSQKLVSVTPKEMLQTSACLDGAGSNEFIRVRMTLWQVCAHICERLDTLIRLQEDANAKLDDIRD